MFFIQGPSSGNAPHFLVAETCTVLSSSLPAPRNCPCRYLGITGSTGKCWEQQSLPCLPELPTLKSFLQGPDKQCLNK